MVTVSDLAPFETKLAGAILLGEQLAKMLNDATSPILGERFRWSRAGSSIHGVSVACFDTSKSHKSGLSRAQFTAVRNALKTCGVDIPGGDGAENSETRLHFICASSTRSDDESHQIPCIAGIDPGNLPASLRDVNELIGKKQVFQQALKEQLRLKAGPANGLRERTTGFVQRVASFVRMQR